MPISQQYHDALQKRALYRQDEQIGFDTVGPLLPRTVDTLTRLSARGHADSSYMLGEHYLASDDKNMGLAYLTAAWRQAKDHSTKESVRQAVLETMRVEDDKGLIDAVMGALSGHQQMQEIRRYGTGSAVTLDDIGPSAG